MKTKFQLATGPLSYLKEITIDLELKGKHFDQLVTADAAVYERAVLSVLGDLMDEDPYQLTMQEMYHAFTLVKVSSFGSKVPLNIRCQHVVRDGSGNQRECGCSNSVEYSLSDSDVVYASADYKMPEIDFETGGRVQRFVVRPPTMTQELDLVALFAERGISRDAMTDDKGLMLEYAKHRVLLHLRNKESGDSFFDRKQRAAAVGDIASNSLLFMKRASELMEEVNSFGVSNKRMQLTCKECGGKLSYRLPLSAGLSL
jgi:hypothetical protein